MYEVLHDKFQDIIIPSESMVKIWGEGRWTEGPVYQPQLKTLIWSDIPNNRLIAFNEITEDCYIFNNDSGYQNGHTTDQFGRIIACEHLKRRVTRLEFDGSWKILSSEYNGKKFNSPNDVSVFIDGSIWFTDPTYGIDFNHLGSKSTKEMDFCGVYRISPDGKDVQPIIKNIRQPNGIAFSPDNKWLYVSDSGTTHDKNHPSVIFRYPIIDNKISIKDVEEFAVCKYGVFDGFRLDSNGNLFTSCEKGVEVYDPKIGIIGRILTPECVANLCFGGDKLNRLYITATSSLYAIYLNTKG